MVFEELIKCISDLCLLTDWQPDDEGAYSMFIDSKFELNIAKDNDFVVFRCFFGNFKKRFGHSFLEKFKMILQWNFWHVKNSDDIVCFSRLRRQICITKVEKLIALDEESVKMLLDEFLKNVGFWKDVSMREKPSIDLMKFKPELLIR